MEEKSGRRALPSYTYLKFPGLKEDLPMVITQEVFDSCINYEPDADDTFVITYPKCGTTWLNNILYLMTHNGEPVPDGDNLANHCLFMEFIGGAATKEGARPRLIKTHLWYRMLKQNPNAKYLVVGRNAKDCVASFYYHTIGYNQFYDWPHGKFDDFFEIFISGGCDWGDFFEMTAEWWQASLKHDNIYFMLYEDMKADLAGELRKLADFLGGNKRELIEKNDGELLKKIIQHSSFSSMKEIEKRFSYGRPKELPFLRKGEVGEWRNCLSKEQSERIDEKIQETSQRYPGFQKLWSKYDHLLQFH